MSHPQSSAANSELRGIGGWLVLVAIGQVLGPIQLFIGLVMYQTGTPAGVWSAYPVAMAVELLMTLTLIGIAVWTSILFFGKRKSFPRMFTIEWVAATLYFPLTSFWAAAATGLPVSSFVAGEDWLRWIALSFVGFLWVLYVQQSVRVRNTFVE